MKKTKNNLREKLKKLKLIAFDFDGIFTDGKVAVNEDGVESIVCSRKDSFGLNLLQKMGLQLVVITREPNKIVLIRSKKIGLECINNTLDKLGDFKKIISKKRIKPGEAAFMGDDLNDLACMKYAGTAFTVSDAHPDCKSIADYITIRKGGDHAVKEVCDLIISARS